ncbi:Pol polyprotein [Plecturocebus cupreus]
MEAATLPLSTASQQAELIALTHALTLAKGQHVNIYPDSKYAFHILHHHATIWAERFLTTQGSSIINALLIKALLKVTLLPAKARVIHCKGHQKTLDPIAQEGSKCTNIPSSLTIFLFFINYSYLLSLTYRQLVFGAKKILSSYLTSPFYPLFFPYHFHGGYEPLASLLEPLISFPSWKSILKTIISQCSIYHSTNPRDF